MAVTRDTSYPSYDSAGTSKYVPLLFSKKVLRRFYATSAYELVANTDYEGEIKKAGDKVIIRRAPDITISDYVIGQNSGSTPSFDYEVPEEVNTELVIDTAKKYAFQIDDIDAVSSDLKLMNMFVENANKKMQVEIDTAVLADWCASPNLDANNIGTTAGIYSGNLNMGATTTPRAIVASGSTSDAVDFLIDAELCLLEQDIMEEKWAIVPTWVCSSLKSGDLRRADITGDSTGAIRTGLVGTVNGMTIIANNNLPKTATEFDALVGTKEAVTFAMQMTKNETLRIQDSFGEYARGLVVFGTEVVQPKALVHAVLSRA